MNIFIYKNIKNIKKRHVIVLIIKRFSIRTTALLYTPHHTFHCTALFYTHFNRH